MCVEIYGKYGNSDINHRFEFIYKNYSDFEFMISGYKNLLLDNIHDLKDYYRMKNKDDLGVRIMGSLGTSDPTFRVASEDLAISNAVEREIYEEGFWDEIEEKEELIAKIEELNLMQSDYKVFCNCFLMINGSDRKFLQRYLESDVTLNILADEMNLSLDTVKWKVKGAKKNLKQVFVKSNVRR